MAVPFKKMIRQFHVLKTAMGACFTQASHPIFIEILG